MTPTRRGLLAGAGALAGTALLSRRGIAQARPVTLAYGPNSPIYALGSVADLKGYFGDEGITLKLLVGNAGTHGRQAVAAGQAQAAFGDPSHALQLSARGKPCRIVMSNEAPPSISYIVVRRDLHDAGIDSIARLAAYKRPNGGKPVLAATAIGAGTWLYGTYVFESKGFGQAVTWVAGGGLNTMLPALESRQFDAIMAPPSWVVEIEAKGFGRVIFDPTDPATLKETFGGPLPASTVYVLADMLVEQPALMQSFVNAMYRAMRWMKTSPIDEVYALVGERLYPGQDKAAVIAELGFEPRNSAFDGFVGRDAFERHGRVWYRAGSDIPETRYDDIVDMTLVKAAQARYR